MKSQILLPLTACAGVFASEVQNRASNWTVGQTVQTSSGPVNGHAASVNTGVSVYLGIPFAIPPVGDLRWTAPQKYNGTGTINGTSYGFSCPADLSYYAGTTPSAFAANNWTAAGVEIFKILGEAGARFGEDCLTLNVWTKPQVGDAKKAVLVWIYGGGFNTGNTDIPPYDGEYFVEQEDVILVTLNYRVNIFGFPGSSAVTQNLGLLDQRLAIEWVRDNIAAFGGDTSRITIFGQSAGAESVDYYSFAYPKDPIISSYIPQSGTFLLLPQLKPVDQNKAFNTIASSLGCDSTADSSSILSCMRGKPFADIVTSLGSHSNLTFNPVVDETVVFSDYLNRSKAGNFIQKPMLIGNTNYEAGLFKAQNGLHNMTSSESYWSAFNSIGFVCPAGARANISISHGVPTWRYRYFGEFANTRLTYSPNSGAYHSSDIAPLFDVVTSGPGIPESTEAQISIGKYMRGAWAAFAKDPVGGLTAYGWPQYSPTGDTLIRLAYSNITGANLARGDSYDTCLGTTFEVMPLANGTTTASATKTQSPTASATTTGAKVTVTGGAQRLSGWAGYGLLIGVACCLL